MLNKKSPGIIHSVKQGPIANFLMHAAHELYSPQLHWREHNSLRNNRYEFIRIIILLFRPESNYYFASFDDPSLAGNATRKP